MRNLNRATAIAAAVKEMKAPHGETSDTYARVMAVLNKRWRVALCPDGIQWILQQRVSATCNLTGRWKNRSFCRWKETLLRCCKSFAGEISPEARRVLDALPCKAEANQ